MTEKSYTTPNEDDLVELSNGSCMEHRDGETLVWDEEWYEAERPISVFQGEKTISEMEMWLAGWNVGYIKGRADGTHQGFRNCQAGFRALLGAASAADVNVLLAAAEEARR